MRIPSSILLIAGVFLIGGCNSGQAQPKVGADGIEDPTPSRRPGLWRQTMLVEGSEGLSVLNLCLDASADRQLSWWGASRGFRQGCGRSRVERRPNGAWRFSSVCELPGGTRMETLGEAVGDFNEKYQLRAETTTQSSPIVALIGTKTISIDAEWQGPCPTGMRPGDARLEDGRTINLLELAASTQPSG